TIFNNTYGFTNMFLPDGLGHFVHMDGANETIAIVDAYGSPSIVNDVQTFDSHWGLSDLDANGRFFLTVQPLAATKSTVPTDDGSKRGWASETALDVEWAHSVAPGAHILLIEAPSPSTTDMLLANVYAAKQKGVVVVSNSWGVDNNNVSIEQNGGVVPVSN